MLMITLLPCQSAIYKVDETHNIWRLKKNGIFKELTEIAASLLTELCSTGRGRKQASSELATSREVRSINAATKKQFITHDLHS